MILRGLATLVLGALLLLNLALPTTSIGRRGSETKVRADVATDLLIGKTLPPFELVGLDGRVYSRDDLLGHRVLLIFERSADW